MGERPGLIIYSKHTSSTDTHTMAHFTYVIFLPDPPVPFMYHFPLPPHHFNPSVPLAYTSHWNHVGHIWVICSILVDDYLSQSGIKMFMYSGKILPSKNHFYLML